MSEKDGSVSEREDVSINLFWPEHAEGSFGRWIEWCFGWEEAGGNT